MKASTNNCRASYEEAPAQAAGAPQSADTPAGVGMMKVALADAGHKPACPAIIFCQVSREIPSIVQVPSALLDRVATCAFHAATSVK